MKTKNLIILVLATVFFFSFISSPAWAGSRQQHRWEGVAIGIGAAILGNAILNDIYSRPRTEPVYSYSPPPRHRGHWEMRSVWVPATHKKVWNPAHYSRDGRWVRAGWISVVENPGYWTKDRVWIARR